MLAPATAPCRVAAGQTALLKGAAVSESGDDAASPAAYTWGRAVSIRSLTGIPPRVVGLPERGVEKRGVRPHTHRGDEDLGGERPAVLQTHAGYPAVLRQNFGDPGPGLDRQAVTDEVLPDDVGGPLIEDPGGEARLLFENSDPDAPLLQVAGQLHPDETAPHDGEMLQPGAGGQDPLGVGGGPKGVNPLGPDAGDGRDDGGRPGGDEEPVVMQNLAAGEGHRLPLNVDGRGPLAAAKLHPVLLRPGGHFPEEEPLRGNTGPTPSR